MSPIATFTPPTDDIVSPIYIVDDPWYPVDPTAQKLMRHFREQTRGRNIFAMSDGTFQDSQINGTPPNMIIPATDPYARAVFVAPGSGNLTEEDFFQEPYVVRTYYGGANNYVSPAEVTALTAAGYGPYIH